MTRAHNFSAGPAALPLPVLEQARAEMLDWRGKGLSVMEMSHRSAEFESIAAAAEADLRALLGVSDEYAVLFLQGGATAQFAMVPINLMADVRKADYVHTGQWAKKAIDEAKRFGEVNIAASAESSSFCHVPAFSEWRLSKDAAYVHMTHNETIGGVEFPFIPETGAIPLVNDASSNLLARPLDVSKFGVIYAGAQKNLGPAGITVVIVRRDLLGRARKDAPSLFDYKVHADNGSMYNTPPTYAWYLAGLVLKWIAKQGGLPGMAERNARKANKLYAAIDNSNFYRCPVRKDSRSVMNVPFTLADNNLDDDFVQQAEAAQLLNLKGHRSVGGMRASLYNAIEESSVDALVAFMQVFERKHG